MLRIKQYIGMAILLLCACDPKPPAVRNDVKLPGPGLMRDLPEIRSEGTIVLLTENTSSSYYLFQGRPMGYDYELIKRFAEDHGLKFRVKVIDDLNSMFDLLNNGEGDLIACNLTITPERKEFLYFTQPVMHTRQVLVQRKPENYKLLNNKQLDTLLVRDVAQLAGKKVYVHQFSTYYKSLVSLEGKITEPINIRLAEGDFNTEDLIRMVADGEIDYTITDENQGILNAAYYRNIDVKTVISDEEPIAIALRNNSDSLLQALNQWLSDKKTLKFNTYLEKKYFHAVNEQRSRFESDFSSLSGKKLSNWDKTIKEQSKKIGWDWRLLGAMIYHESRFDPNARSWAGAFGLMQLMPETAARFGIDTTQTEDENIVAGVKYLKFLEEFWANKIPDPTERSKFILASYNIGPGHVQDAQFIAESQGLDPKIWDGNVEQGMQLKAQSRFAHMKGVKHGFCRGPSVAEYVRQVLLYYEQLSQTLK